MRRILICSGVLGAGTALVIGAAALTAVLIPPGRVVPRNQDTMFAGPMPVAIDRAFPVVDGGGWAAGPAPFDGSVAVTTNPEGELPARDPAH